MAEGQNASTSSWSSIPVNGAALGALVVEPASATGTILMIHENRGLVPYMVAVAEELVASGYRVVAPDLLSRIGGTASHADNPDAVSTRQIEPETHIADLNATFDWIAMREVPAIVGFCFGAEMGWQVITKRQPLGAALLYGIGPSAADVRRIACPVYAAYAQDDDRVNSTVDVLGPALAATAVEYILESYPGTRHAFHDRTRPDRFDGAAAAVVWDRTLAFLEQLFDTS